MREVLCRRRRWFFYDKALPWWTQKVSSSCDTEFKLEIDVIVSNEPTNNYKNMGYLMTLNIIL